MSEIHWRDANRGQGNGFAKPFIVQMLSPNGYLLHRKVAGVSSSVRYDRAYVVQRLFDQFIDPFAATFLSDEEVHEKVNELVTEAMRLRSPEYAPKSDIPVEAESIASVDSDTAKDVAATQKRK